MLKRSLATLLLALSSHLSLFADPKTGEELERQIWQNMKARNWSALESQISANFQSVHPDGARDRSQEIDLIKGLNLGNYKLSHFETTEGPNTIIVTYLISVGETIDKDRLSSKPAPRLSVWQKNGGQWQWIAHANLNTTSALLSEPVK